MKLSLDKFFSTPSRQVDDPCMDFGKVVGHELKSMSNMQRKLAKKLLNDVIYLGNMDMLTVKHKVS